MPVRAGASPAEVVRTRLWDRVSGSLTPLRPSPDGGELVLVEEAAAGVDFPLVVPSRIPRGYRLTALDVVPNSRDVMTFVYRASPLRSFRFTQRTHALALADELRLARVPSLTMSTGRGQRHVICGGFVGEPVDVWHWHRTRRSVAWEQEGLICELEAIIASSPSLWAMLRVADRVEVWRTATAGSRAMDSR